MKDEKKGFLLKDVRSMNRVSGVCGVGVLLYLGVAMLNWALVKDVIAIVFALVAVWNFFSVAELRGKDKEAVSYNLLWGTGSLALLLGACAVLAVKVRFGL